MNVVGCFEIPVTDMARAVDFYRSVFGVDLESTTIDGNAMALFPGFTGASGPTGALAKSARYVPSIDGTRVYFIVPSIEQTLQRTIDKGGRELYPKTSIGELGFAEFQDCEGNRIALSSER